MVPLADSVMVMDLHLHQVVELATLSNAENATVARIASLLMVRKILPDNEVLATPSPLELVIVVQPADSVMVMLLLTLPLILPRLLLLVELASTSLKETAIVEVRADSATMEQTIQLV